MEHSHLETVVFIEGDLAVLHDGLRADAAERDAVDLVAGVLRIS